MNKKGFTLVELLAIVVILAIIIVAAAPNMTKQVKKSEEETQNILNQKIENASKLYAAKYYANKIISCDSSDCGISFTLNDLEQDGLINLKGKCEDKKTKNINVSYNSGDKKIIYNYTNIKDDNNSCYACQTEDYTKENYCIKK